jgi:O-acetyl-ADP-ribose deacetylase (regulator of RNase III)
LDRPRRGPGTGIYGYPLVEATEVAVRTCRADAPAHIELIRFVCFDEHTLQAYERELAVDGGISG